MYSLFLVSLSTFYAMRNVDSALIDMARTLGASEVEVFFRIMVPAASPLVFAGLRVGLARSVKGMINGEMFIAAVGLGARTMEFGSMFDAAGVLAIVLLIVIIALITTGLFQMIERRVTRWTELGRS
jgi:NitT/TauT family transport system permease protein